MYLQQPSYSDDKIDKKKLSNASTSEGCPISLPTPIPHQL